MSNPETRNGVPRPFLKWVGGKSQLLKVISAYLPTTGIRGRYHEPFIGGGALFFHLYRQGLLSRKLSYLSDANHNLVDAYKGVKDVPERVIELLRLHETKHSHDHYYEVRASRPRGLAEKAARLIYLNKTCYNGLYRENNSGFFNVPIGSNKNPAICDENNIRSVSIALKRTRLECQPFERALEYVEPGDLVYLDPPYVPLNRTSSFTAYAKNGFGADDQERLAAEVSRLVHMQVNVLVSNSYTPVVKQLYQIDGLKIEKVLANRSVNSKPDQRGKIPEVLISNLKRKPT